MSKSILLATTLIVAVGAVTAAVAAPQGPYNWTSFYAGVNAGGAWGAYDPTTATTPGAYFGLPLYSAAVNAIGAQTLDPRGFIGGGQIGFNYQIGNIVAGVEGAFDYLHLNAAANSAAAYPGLGGSQFLISTYGNADWLFTLTPRLGFAANNWLFYGMGGLAVTNLRTDFVFTDRFGAFQSALVSTDKVGYAIGAGVEWGLTDRLSLRAEYEHVGFGRTAAHQTGSDIPAQPFTQSAALNADFVRVGLDYKLGDPSATTAFGRWLSPGPAAFNSDWEVDLGSRTWLSNGMSGAPNPLYNYGGGVPNPLASRILFSDLVGYSGETYARVEHSSGVFAKAFLGAGAITGGQQKDEDFPAFAVYSNTLSSVSGSHLGYANADVGYNIFKSGGGEFGPFVGVNYFTEHVNSFGCNQIAGDYFCGVPQTVDGLTQNDAYTSLRLGVSERVMLTDRLRLTAEAAYLPWVHFQGVDDHNFRQLLLPESSSNGDGVMLEADLDYRVTDAWSVGVGARYWAYNMRDGKVGFDFLGFPPVFNEPARYNAERYGLFFQTEYRIGGSPGSPGPAPSTPLAPANWTGVYAGGSLGGGLSNSHWSDPFGPTTSGGATNLAGFGDKIHAPGPVAGAQIAANWQTGNWVIGGEAEAAWSDMRNDGTCFSGLGGMDCQQHGQALYDVALRGGFAWDRSWLYAKAGAAWASTRYDVWGDSFYASYGNGGSTKLTGGWLAGAGLEYALSDKWSASLEYDHVGLAAATPSFPGVAPLAGQPISVRQSLDEFKVGLNYKLF